MNTRTREPRLDRESARRQHRHKDTRLSRHQVVVFADNVDKVSNLGSILRTSEAFGCEAVVTNRKEIDTAGAMGAEHWQPVFWNADLDECCHDYSEAGYVLVAIEQTDKGVPMNHYHFANKTVLMVGAEMFGLSTGLLERADDILYIPQSGLVKSLNVAVATSLALYEYSRQHWMRDFIQPTRHLKPAIDSARIPSTHRITGKHRG